MSDRNFTYEIKKRMGVLSSRADGDYTTEINLISYNGAAPKIDIRKWDRRDGEKMLKGITLSRDEWDALKAIAMQEGAH